MWPELLSIIPSSCLSFTRRLPLRVGEETQTAESNGGQSHGAQEPSFSVSELLYRFFQVQDTSFILCIVVIQPEIPVKQLKNLNTVPSSKLLYHRLDLLGQPSACLHFKQLATLGKAPHFSASSWSDSESSP